MNTKTSHMTETEFVNYEKSIWGVEEVEELIERGFVPVFLGTKWSWRLLPETAFDKSAVFCYN